MSIYFIPNADRGLSNYAGRNVRFGFPLPARERRMQSLLDVAHHFAHSAGATAKGYRILVDPVQRPDSAAVAWRAELISVDRDAWGQEFLLRIILSTGECAGADEAVEELDAVFRTEEEKMLERGTWDPSWGLPGRLSRRIVKMELEMEVDLMFWLTHHGMVEEGAAVAQGGAGEDTEEG
ncbi:hypothetical protein GTA08_BOTSDO08205 [Botryosphaeria dothidea]|uniref:Uncharacterized protein n=1 Tax=Botryosphaeria dothidea TaxID=55169 RepID=A0A8H4N2P7_9PEZI|nr:hypothetical protein GTA08_BOTSDO08205 [Botryosphaeria dothidea]